MASVVSSPPSGRIDECENCPICLDGLSPENIFIIEGCGHLLCTDCEPDVRKSTLSTCYDNDKLVKVIKCPICRTPEEPSKDLLKKRIQELNSMVRNNRHSNGNKVRDLEEIMKNIISQMKKIRQMKEVYLYQILRNGDQPLPFTDLNVSNARNFLRNYVIMRHESGQPVNIIPPEPPRETTHNIDQPVGFVAFVCPRPLPQQSGTRLSNCCVPNCRSSVRTRRLCRMGCGRNCCAVCAECNHCRPRTTN